MRFHAMALGLACSLYLCCSPERTDQDAPAAQEVVGDKLEPEGKEILKPGLEGWEVTGKREAFSFSDGALYCDGSGGRLIYYAAEPFKDFVLTTQVKVSEGANSGIFLRVADPRDAVQTGVEIQVLDSFGKETPDKHDFGAVYDIKEPSRNAVRPPGEWNEVMITCEGPRIQVEVNDEKVIDIDLSNWTEAGKNPDGTPNKFRRPYKEMTHPGFIGFQDHGKPVWYRNLIIKKLD